MLFSRCLFVAIVALALMVGCPDDATTNPGSDVPADAPDTAGAVTDASTDASITDPVDVSPELPSGDASTSDAAASDASSSDAASDGSSSDAASDAITDVSSSDAAVDAITDALVVDVTDISSGDVNDVGSDGAEDTGTPDAPTTPDASSDAGSDASTDATGYDFAGFINKVVTAYGDSGQVQDCATAFPPVAVSDAAALEQAVASHIETLTGIAPSAPMDQACGTPDAAVCANIFQFYVFATNGNLGTALHPCAQELDKVCDPVVQTWTVTDPQSSQHSAVSMSCIVEGQALGILYIDGFASCSTFSQN